MLPQHSSWHGVTSGGCYIWLASFSWSNSICTSLSQTKTFDDTMLQETEEKRNSMSNPIAPTSCLTSANVCKRHLNTGVGTASSSVGKVHPIARVGASQNLCQALLIAGAAALRQQPHWNARGSSGRIIAPTAGAEGEESNIGQKAPGKPCVQLSGMVAPLERSLAAKRAACWMNDRMTTPQFWSTLTKPMMRRPRCKGCKMGPSAPGAHRFPSEMHIRHPGCMQGKTAVKAQ